MELDHPQKVLVKMFKLNDELGQVIIQQTLYQCYKIATAYNWQTDGDGQFDQQLPKHRTGISLGKKSSG
jgi:hypothetical protein